MRIELAHHDVGALHEAHPGLGIDAGARCQHVLDPGAAGIDQRAGSDGAAAAVQSVLHRDVPDAVNLPDLDRAGAGADVGAAIGRVARVERDEPRVVDETVGIFKGLFVTA